MAVNLVKCQRHEWCDVTTFGDPPNRRTYICTLCGAHMEETRR